MSLGWVSLLMMKPTARPQAYSSLLLALLSFIIISISCMWVWVWVLTYDSPMSQNSSVQYSILRQSLRRIPVYSTVLLDIVTTPYYGCPLFILRNWIFVTIDCLFPIFPSPLRLGSYEFNYFIIYLRLFIHIFIYLS